VQVFKFLILKLGRYSYYAKLALEIGLLCFLYMLEWANLCVCGCNKHFDFCIKSWDIWNGKFVDIFGYLLWAANVIFYIFLEYIFYELAHIQNSQRQNEM